MFWGASTHTVHPAASPKSLGCSTRLPSLVRRRLLRLKTRPCVCVCHKTRLCFLLPPPSPPSRAVWPVLATGLQPRCWQGQELLPCHSRAPSTQPCDEEHVVLSPLPQQGAKQCWETLVSQGALTGEAKP